MSVVYADTVGGRAEPRGGGEDVSPCPDRGLIDAVTRCLRHDGQWRGPRDVHALLQAMGVNAATEQRIQGTIWKLLNARVVEMNGKGELRLARWAA
jgi:hypothetical protein